MISDTFDKKISQRKLDHLELCRDKDVESKALDLKGFDCVSLLPEAVPDFDWSDLSTSTRFLGNSFSLPILITGMTGGISEGQEINYRLALVAEKLSIPMGVGSQRIALEHSEYEEIFKVKDKSPNVFLIGNIGFGELVNENAVSLCERAVKMIDADALAIHLNLLQESIQQEGNRSFRGFWQQLPKITKSLSVPVIVKEVGSGISVEVANRLLDCGVAAIDCGGQGGTSWGYIEGLRGNQSDSERIGSTFRNWGIPTVYNTYMLRKSIPNMNLISTGGVRTGLDVAKLIALGANISGIGLPLMKAALVSSSAVVDLLETIKKELKIAMLSSGARDLQGLKKRIVWGRPYELEVKGCLTQKKTR